MNKSLTPLSTATQSRHRGGKGMLAAALFTACLTGAAAAESTPPDIDTLEQHIKAEEGSQSKSQILEATGQLNAASHEALSSSAALRSGTTVYVSHSRSLVEEALYHLEQVAPYADYEDRIYLRKLQALKRNKLRFDQGEISRARFNAEAERIDGVYREELQEAQEYLAEKTERLYAICGNLEQNTQGARENLHTEGSEAIPATLAQRLLTLRKNRLWQEFSAPTGEGQQARNALAQVDEQAPERVAGCIGDAFAAMEKKPRGPIVNPNLVTQIVAQFR